MKTKKYIIALDQGTTSSRAVIFDKNTNIVAKAQKEFMQIYPKPGWVEHDPIEIWATQRGMLSEVIAKSGIDIHEIASIGITNQRETVVVWEKDTGKPIYNAIVWQCRRTADICEKLKLDGMTEYIAENTGLVIDAYFSGTKIKWILDHVDGARAQAERGELLCGTIDTWLVWKLTGVHVTDYTNASRTMLYNIKTLQWDETMLKALNIPSNMLPKVHNSSEIYGTTALAGFGPAADIPVSAICGDQQAALFGQTCFNKGDTKCTYGTGAFMLMNIGDQFLRSRSGLLTTIAIGLEGKVTYALEGSIFVAGALVQWLRDEMRLVADASDTEYFAKKAGDNGGVYVVPAFTGLGAPYWDMYARGGILGLTRGSNANHIIRASLEAIAYQTTDLLNAMHDDSGLQLTSFKVDGGAIHNTFLLQFISDIIGKTVIKPEIAETTALGAAYLAGLSVGFWKDMDDIKQHWHVSKEFTPSLDQEKREYYYQGWKKAVSRVAKWNDQ
jgi:glycerol kinase